MVLLEGRAAATATTAAGRAVGFSTWTGPCALDKVALLDGSGHTATFAALTPCAVRREGRTAGTVHRAARRLGDGPRPCVPPPGGPGARPAGPADGHGHAAVRCGARPDSRPGSWNGRWRADPSPPPCPCPAASANWPTCWASPAPP
ncbi:hypothetical protein OG252_30495 [Streptomyces sp. NBC_01352]